MPLSNSTNSARKMGDAFGHAHTTVTGANGDHVRALHETILAYVFDYLDSKGIPFERHRGIPPDMVLGCLLPPGQPSNYLDSY